jgi:GH25 family lysozyme M1 (1,4-beta-N-acetylmuramidase)
MHVARRPLHAFILVAALATLALPAFPAAAAQAPAAALGGQAGAGHFNVGATHSPELLQALAGPLSPTALAHPMASAMISAAVAAPAVASPDAAIAGAAQGIDVASGQHAGGPINWAQVAGAGYQFAAVKATEGNYYVNPYYATDLPAAKAAGLSVIGYGFANPYPDSVPSNGTAAQQAQYLVTKAKVASGVPPLMLDIEYNPYAASEKKGNECYGITTAAMVTWISQFVAEVQSLTGHVPIIYTTQDWWSTCTGNSAAFGHDPIWLANYSTTPPLPAGWSTWALWQYSSSGNVPGISGYTDLDQMNPAAVPLFAPGTQNATAGSAVTPVTVSPFTVTSSPALVYAATGLPPGLSVNPASGQVSGIPTAAGAYQVTVTATAGNATGSASFTWNVSSKVTVTSPGTLSTVAGNPVDQQVDAADSATGQTLSYSATGLPPGLSISSQGLVTGWPAPPAGTHQVTVTVTDALKASGSASFSWTVTAAPNTGPAGPVRLGLAGKCLDDTAGSSANGTKIQTWSCNGDGAQNWTAAQDRTVRIQGKCLSVAGSATANGSKVALETCSGAASQQWQPGTGAQLVNPASGRCLDDTGASTANGVAVQIWACTGQPNQKWTLPAGPVMSQIPGHCVDDANGSSVNGNPIELGSCDGSSAQNWTVEPDGTVRILGSCLEAPAASSGSPLDLNGCGSGSAAQQWRVVAEGAGAELQNPQSGLCLADPGDITTSGTRLVVGACSAADPGADWRIQ